MRRRPTVGVDTKILLDFFFPYTCGKPPRKTSICPGTLSVSARALLSNLLAIFIGLLITLLLLFGLEWGARQLDYVPEKERRPVKTYLRKKTYRYLDDNGLYLANPGDHESYKQYRDNKEYLFRVT
jgi:hypothetical protein